MLNRLAAKLAALKDDRGEGPVPYIILVVIIAGVAVIVGAAITGVANDWIADLRGVSAP